MWYCKKDWVASSIAVVQYWQQNGLWLIFHSFLTITPLFFSYPLWNSVAWANVLSGALFYVWPTGSLWLNFIITKSIAQQKYRFYLGYQILFEFFGIWALPSWQARGFVSKCVLKVNMHEIALVIVTQTQKVSVNNNLPNCIIRFRTRLTGAAWISGFSGWDALVSVEKKANKI